MLYRRNAFNRQCCFDRSRTERGRRIPATLLSLLLSNHLSHPVSRGPSSRFAHTPANMAQYIKLTTHDLTRYNATCPGWCALWVIVTAHSDHCCSQSPMQVRSIANPKHRAQKGSCLDKNPDWVNKVESQVYEDLYKSLRVWFESSNDGRNWSTWYVPIGQPAAPPTPKAQRFDHFLYQGKFSIPQAAKTLSTSLPVHTS